jgi:hypothetical protein
VFGANETVGPELAVLNEDSFHGPSTTPHTGLLAYVFAFLACALMKLKTAAHLDLTAAPVAAAHPPLTGLAPAEVTSHAPGIGVISASWL